MYYRMRFSAHKAMYTTDAQAQRLLLQVYLKIEEEGGTILDYTLIPTLLDLLIYLPRTSLQFGFLSWGCTLEYIPSAQALLHHYRSLSSALPLGGKNYPLCGTYEAYHGSNSYSSLGKGVPFPQELSIQSILREKSSLPRSLERHA